jgi:hypothetical protein
MDVLLPCDENQTGGGRGARRPPPPECGGRRLVEDGHLNRAVSRAAVVITNPTYIWIIMMTINQSQILRMHGFFF